ncbi:hypothetical protein [Stenotrophomonas sp. PFBMAA-4]|uniref:hypothetical protein n=1 Tax=Stenotrophomonas sp. PFBMAA-4 TaxID=3043301 RepID=UPI0024B4B162|nr:hypothetical protein [Stenotrophomonas sp. PFBMAA-4]MDI9271429.1 hypothetical protein [Stenotrophomonas sp. PFBMAA-4]
MVDLVEVITFESYSRRLMGVPTHVDVGATTRAGDSTMSVGSAARQKGSAFENFDSRKFKESLMTIKGQIGRNVKAPNIQFDLIELGGNQFSDLVRESETYSLETSAQWLRFVAGAGASAQAEWDPLHRKVSAKVEASAHYKLALFEAKAVHTWSIPSRTGWMQRYGDIDLGAIVFQMSLELHGFAGMKRALMGAAGVTIDRGAVKVEAQPRDRDDSFVPSFDIVRGMPRADMGDPPDKDGKPSGRFVMAAVGEKPPKSLNGMQVNAEAFVGVEAGLTPAGELQWLPPQQGKPVTLAKLSQGLAGSAGAGVKAQLYVFYADGRFRIKVSARLCLGIGCRGSLDFVVGVEGMLEFAKWVYYQLAHAGFKELLFIAGDALEYLSQIVLLLFSRDGSIADYLVGSIEVAKERVGAVVRSNEIAKNRLLLVRRINAAPMEASNRLGGWLVYATPMTRGMLLYAITRHNWMTHTQNPVDVEGLLDFQVHYLPDHKKAVIRVIKGITLVSEWQAMFQHMTAEGEPSDKDPGKLEGDVIRFLNYGFSLSDDLKGKVIDPINAEGEVPSGQLGNIYLEQFLAHRNRLLGSFPKGYELADLQMMDVDSLLALDGKDAGTFASIDSEYLDTHRRAHGIAAKSGRGIPVSAS